MKAFNLDRHWQDVHEKVNDLANKYLMQGICQQGSLTEDLEQKILQTTKTKYCATFGSGTAALTQGLRSLNLPPKTEVLVPAYTFLATASAILLAGLSPVFVDVDEYYHIDLNDAERKAGKNTKVLIYVTLLGSPAIQNISDWCKERNIYLVEDAAQSLGAPHSDCIFSVLSFSPTKPCTSFGSGGAVITNNFGIYYATKLGRLHGKQKNDDISSHLGINSVMSTHEVASVMINLDLLNKHQSRRTKIAQYYYFTLGNHVDFARYRAGSTYSKFVIQHMNRDNMPGTVHYKQCPYQEDIFVKYRTDTPKNTLYLQRVSKTLPNCAYMTDSEVDTVVQAVKAAS